MDRVYLVVIDLERFKANALREGVSVGDSHARELLLSLGLRSHPSGRYECDGYTLMLLESDEVSDIKEMIQTI